MERVIIYGTGKFYRNYKEKVEELYEIESYIDKTGFLEGKEIPRSISECIYDGKTKILIMVENIKICFEIINNLLINSVASQNIILGLSKWGIYSQYDYMNVNEDGKIIVSKNNIMLEISNADEFDNATEVLLYENYQYCLFNSEHQIVLDVGMNIGDATLFFLEKENVDMVYGYEPFPQTFLKAKKNLSQYGKHSNYEIYDFGWSNDEGTLEIEYNDEMTCGQSSIIEFNDRAIEDYKKNYSINTNKSKKEVIHLKRSSEIVKEIICKHPNHDIVLKLDCEGAEYEILKDLEDYGLLNNLSLIMLEWHYNGSEEIEKILRQNQFSYTTSIKCLKPYLGVINAIRNPKHINE